MNLKHEPALLDVVAELQTDSDLRDAVRIINNCAGLFSVGCVSGVSSDQRGFWRNGYVEFAINSKSHVQDAMNYFRIFYLFDCELSKMSFAHPVKFNWELQPATFIDAGTQGYTCAVFVTTELCREATLVQPSWSAALAALAQILSTVPSVGEPIYS